ncbi:hypothetical protein FB565_002990 [Actinoplanes lutulentus]|uniref:Helix-hairpin-helix protein n=1 Tax=Actinoplanes lutulentus TaxID=1287878 RepID=A0A327Z687_9ACTN|nr:hypothetical protein [Actinoplanes lutulentus]MBB2943277.1 hypothetical protein [Actinoplanes lutulentus]RAK28337.1 hypothetical protein B0I29_120105 [Actinoplanes lutulentus]
MTLGDTPDGLFALDLDISMPPRVAAALRRAGITSTAGLLRLSERELRALRGVGGKTATQLMAVLDGAGMRLAPDAWGAYTCARDSKPASDAGLAGFFLCDTCRNEYSVRAFGGKDPEWVSREDIEGNCGHCNESYRDLRLTQWFLCGVCERVLRSIGRGLASAKYVLETWKAENIEEQTGLRLRETDPPQLRPRGRRTDLDRVSNPDFTLYDQNDVPVAGFELKSGKKAAARGDGVGDPMSRFQLDTTDCDDILTVVDRESFPIYLVHAQIIGRANPPTEIYRGVGLWWADLWSMEDKFLSVDVRPRETRNAAYYKPTMFRPIREFSPFVQEGGIAANQAKLEQYGPPSLYTLKEGGHPA